MNPMIEAGIAEWGANGGCRLAFGAYKELTLDMAASIFVGIDLGPETTRVNRVFEDLVAASMSRVRLPIPGLEFHRGLKGREFLVRSFRDLLPKKRADHGQDMFSRLCHAQSETGERFSDDDVIDHMIFLMMAAHDTTTSTLTSMTYELARHPEWQERIRDEARALGKPWLGFDDLDEPVSLGWAMRETLRRYPPLPVIPRVAGAAFRFEDHRIEEGSMVVVSPIHTHHMPEWWSEHALGSRALRARARRAGAPHPLLDPVRRRPAPLHRAALRGAPGEGGAAPARAPLPLERGAGLHDAPPAGADLEAPRRPPGALRADRLSAPPRPREE
jgi:cytochrome P450